MESCSVAADDPFVAFVQKTLNSLYPNPRPSLTYSSSFTLLIAVLLSANSTDKIVNRTTPMLFKKACTPRAMSRLDIKTIEDIIRPIGLANRKAPAIQQLSKLLLLRHRGQVPMTFQELEALPGVGHKTASVVLTQAFNIPAFPVDTHIHRLAKRWRLSSGRNVKETESDLKAIFPEACWIKLHLQLIFFAREYCQARKHDPEVCPICSKVERDGEVL